MKQSFQKKIACSQLPQGLNLHDLILLNQRRTRAIRRSMLSPIPAIEAIALSYMASFKNASATDLIPLLGMSKSNLGRMIQRFVGQGLVTYEASENDLRFKLLSLTEKAISTLKVIDQINRSLDARTLFPLSEEEQEKLAHYRNILADGLRLPKITARENQSQMRVTRYRFTVGLGMLSDNYYKTGFDIATYQVLLELHLKQNIISYAELGKQAHLNASKLCRAVSVLVTKGFLEKIFEKENTKYFAVRFTSGGYKKFLEIHNDINQRMEAAIDKLNQKERKEFFALLRKPLEIEPPLTEDDSFKLLCCKKSLDFKRARAFLVETLVNSNKHHELDSEILPESHIVVIAEQHGAIRALLEISRDSDEPSTVQSMASQYLDHKTSEAILTKLKKFAARTAKR